MHGCYTVLKFYYLTGCVRVFSSQVSHLFNDPSAGDVIRLALVKVVILETHPVRIYTLH